MTYSIKQLFHTGASPSKVFDALTTVNGIKNWWTIQTTGDASLNGSLQFDFGDYKGPTFKVVEVQANERLVWECLTDNGWLGHTFVFELDQNDGKTRIRFSHNGWEDQGDFYAGCSFSWGRYMQSLRQYCETGNGEAFGSAGYR